MDSVVEGQWWMIWEDKTETCKLSYGEQVLNPGLSHDTVCSGWCTGIDPEDLGWEREVGGGFQWGTHVHPWWLY